LKTGEDPSKLEYSAWDGELQVSHAGRKLRRAHSVVAQNNGDDQYKICINLLESLLVFVSLQTEGIAQITATVLSLVFQKIGIFMKSSMRTHS
jgi:hypothetical protein